MIEVTPYKHKKVVVYGLGKSGKSAIHSLAANGTEVLAWDDNESSRKNLSLSEEVEDILIEESVSITPPQEYDWSTIAAVILSPGIPLTHPTVPPVVAAARKAECPIICDIELLSITTPNIYSIAITGTNGKSTTTALIGHILNHQHKRVQVGGNIGTPVLELEPLDQHGTYVLEVSSYQIDLLHNSQFDTAILLNITPDHLERHGGMEGYVAVKEKIFRFVRSTGVAIIGVDDENCEKIYKKILKNQHIGTIIPISNCNIIKGGIAVIDGVIHDHRNTPKEYSLGHLPKLLGKHNQQNIAAAFAACVTRFPELAVEDIITGIESFHGLDHRLQFVETFNNITFINDSKATNIEAASKALSAFENIFWIAGGLAKDDNIRAIEPLFEHITHAFLIGDAEEKFAQLLENKLSFTRCGTLEKATQEALAMALKQQAKDKPAIVLFSPACASFDQWQNFEERGNAFCDYVLQHKQNMAQG